MQEETQAVDPKKESAPGTGVLGRLADFLAHKGHCVNSISIDNPSIAVTSNPASPAPDPVIVSRNGVTLLDANMEQCAFQLNAQAEQSMSSLFGETISHQFTTGIRQANELNQALQAFQQLGAHWPDDDDMSKIAKRFHAMMKAGRWASSFSPTTPTSCPRFA